MSDQNNLLGAHPRTGPFAVWLQAVDPTTTRRQRYRALTPIQPADIDWLVERLIFHHYNEDRIKRLKAVYNNLNYKKIAEQHRKLPRPDKVKKGNFGEVLLSDYVEACKNKVFAKVLKLRYNPNVDQAMKGDDLLMVNFYRNSSNKEVAEIFLGETKFRARADKDVVDELLISLHKQKVPLSYTFLVDELAKDPANDRLVNKLNKILVDEVKGRNAITYFGLLMGARYCESMIQTHMNTSNDKLLFLSLTDSNLQSVIDQSYQRAENTILTKIKSL